MSASLPTVMTPIRFRGNEPVPSAAASEREWKQCQSSLVNRDGNRALSQHHRLPAGVRLLGVSVPVQFGNHWVQLPGPSAAGKEVVLVELVQMVPGGICA